MTPDEYKRRKRAERYYANREREIARSRAYQTEHAAELREKRMARYRALKAQGICVLCGKAQAAEGRTQCERCRKFHAIYAMRRRSDDSGPEVADQILC